MRIWFVNMIPVSWDQRVSQKSTNKQNKTHAFRALLRKCEGNPCQESLLSFPVLARVWSASSSSWFWYIRLPNEYLKGNHVSPSNRFGSFLGKQRVQLQVARKNYWAAAALWTEPMVSRIRAALETINTRPQLGTSSRCLFNFMCYYNSHRGIFLSIPSSDLNFEAGWK